MTARPKTAALVHYYFGEKSYINRLAQETVPVHLALTDYDHTVLLRHETDIELAGMKFELSERAENKADVIELPTRENFVAQLDRLGKEGYVVDVYIFAHGLIGLFTASESGDYHDGVALTEAYIEAHVDPLQLRMVYGCHCYGSSLNPLWRRLGAKVTAGARFVNFYPTRFKGFVKAWNRGEAFGKAISRSDTALVRTPVQIYIPADAAASAKEWDGNVLLAPTVLGRGKAARRYFEACWLDEGEWQENMSGKQNMNYSSRMLISGNRSVTKKTV